MYFEINYLAVFVAAIAHMAVGMLWYGPLFGKQWMAYVGITPESMKHMPLTMWQAMVGGFITALLMAFVLAVVADTMGVLFWDEALFLSFMVWLGFTSTTIAGSFLWEGKPFGLFVLNAAQSLVSLLIMGLIVVLWV